MRTPHLDCNVWLYKKMWALPDPRVYGQLRPGWLELYERQMGDKPADWEKSFRMAARYCLRRILRVRGEPRGPGAGDPANDRQDGQGGAPSGDDLADTHPGGGPS